MKPELPTLADLVLTQSVSLDYDAAAVAWLRAHVPAGLDARCKACGVEHLRGELSADGLCCHCADELGVMSAPTVAERLPLGTIVTLCNGVAGVISGISTCDASRRRVSYFDRRFWAVRHWWTSIDNLEPFGAAENAARLAQQAPAALSA